MMNYKNFLKYFYSTLPLFVKRKIEVKRKEKRKAVIKERMSSVFVSETDLDEIFSKFTIDTDVFLHSSLTNIGTIEGGVEYVVNKILEKINIEKHTLLIPALPIQGRFIDYLRRSPVFDVRTAPVKMGAVSEYLAVMQGAKRSVHPTHSVVAIGANAKKYTSTHHLDSTPFGVNSPYYKLLENNAEIMYFGVTPYVTTYVHVIEDMFSDLFPVEVYADEEFCVPCLNEYGEPLTVKTKVHDPQSSINRNVLILNQYFIDYGAILFTHPIGDSNIIIADVRKLTIAYLNAMKDELTIYGKFKISPKIKNKISELLTYIENSK